MQEIQKKKVKLVIIAEDASERTKLNFQIKCEENKIPIYEILSIESLSKCIGKNNKAVVGIKDTNFSNEMLKIINGGEVIG